MSDNLNSAATTTRNPRVDSERWTDFTEGRTDESILD